MRKVAVITMGVKLTAKSITQDFGICVNFAKKDTKQI